MLLHHVLDGRYPQDGYAIFSAITAIRALKESGRDHGRCVIVIEACEESGSPDLPFYIEHLQADIGTPGG